MTRIIAGTAGGRRIVVPPGRSTRPTSDRTREALFATVLSELGSLAGAAVLDLYAGSGAVGLEALSRGATEVMLVESDSNAIKAIRRNIASLGLAGATVNAGRAERVLAVGPGPARRRDLVFADPPYGLAGPELTRMLELLAGAGWLAPGALVVIERSVRSEPLSWPGGYSPGRSRSYGESMLWYGRACDDSLADNGTTEGGESA